jgi:hypothetical protein
MAKKNKRARVERRRARRADKRRREQDERKSAGGARLHYVGSYDGTADGLHDDCPMCRAMRYAGIVPDETGVAVVTAAKQRIYERKLAEIIAAEGWPEGAVSLDEDALVLRHQMATRTMATEGWPDDPSDLPPENRAEFFARYSQLVRGDIDVAAAN